MLLLPAAHAETRWPRSREPDASRIVALPDLVVGRHPGRTSAEQITLFGAYESFGPATGYSALGAVVVERARQRGIGRELPAEWFVQSESS
jgi:alanine dehydrogenase